MNMRTPQPLLEATDRELPNDVSHVEVDFSEYMWMGEELEEFDRQVEEELWEEAFIEACFEEMMNEENTGGSGGSGGNNNNHHYQQPPLQQQQQHQCVFKNNMANLEDSMNMFSIRETPVKEEVVKNSLLNPEAPEFVPGNSMKR